MENEFKYAKGFGGIFQNKTKKHAKHPDLNGFFTGWDGKKYIISLWAKRNKKGESYFAMAVKEDWVAEDHIEEMTDMKRVKKQKAYKEPK